MYVLDYLAGKLPGDVSSEYRLLCSGELYSADVITCDWRKSEATRRLVLSPFQLQVVSRPFKEYPQEISLFFACSDSVQETSSTSSTKSCLLHRPDDDIAKDLAVLLTLFLRRLLTVYAKVRIRYPQNPGVPPDQATGEYDLVLPIANLERGVYWQEKAHSIVYSLEGVKEVVDYNPQPLAVSRHTLQSKLEALPGIPHAESYLLSARLYAEAMRVIEDWPEIAYQLLVYSVETIANQLFKEYLPERNDLIAEKREVRERAKGMGASDADADELAILACKGMPWAGRKFRMFLMKHTDESIWNDDDLCRTTGREHYWPTKDQFETSLKDIYASRSKAAHEGRSYDETIRIGIGGTIPVRAFNRLISGVPLEVPPVRWFERVVNVALNRYLELAGKLSSDPMAPKRVMDT